jgi:hypothetical protein
MNDNNNSYMNSNYIQINNNTKNEEKIEVFSLSSTPERKLKIRRKLRKRQKRGNKINKKKKI